VSNSSPSVGHILFDHYLFQNTYVSWFLTDIRELAMSKIGIPFMIIGASGMLLFGSKTGYGASPIAQSWLEIGENVAAVLFVLSLLMTVLGLVIDYKLRG
jgi:CBS-domain-containing membrane protein